MAPSVSSILTTFLLPAVLFLAFVYDFLYMKTADVEFAFLQKKHCRSELWTHRTG